MNFTQQYGQNRQRCQQNPFYYVVWQLLLYFYGEFPSKILSVYNKLIIYKVIIKPVWTYRIQLWRAACISNLEIIQRFQSKTLRLMLDAPWYVTNAVIHRDLEIETVKKEIERYSEHYKERIRTHPNELATNLLNKNLVVRRLKRFKPLDRRDRFK